MIKANDDNAIYLSGVAATQARLDHRLYGEDYHSLMMDVPRLSGAVDTLPVTIPARICQRLPEIGEPLRVDGQIRSYNKRTEQGNRLILTVFARSMATDVSLEEAENRVKLSGYLCKDAVFRTTPFMREICDILIAVNRQYNKSDYLPCIAWGRNAHLARELSVGTRVAITGRLQSRVYQKCLFDGTVADRIAYEVSCTTICEYGGDEV